MSEDIKIIQLKNDNSIGRRLFEIREKRGMTQTQLAAAIDVKGAQISKFECGQASCKTWQLIELARELDVSVAYLTGEITEEEEQKNRLLHRFDELPMDVQRFLLLSMERYFEKGA